MSRASPTFWLFPRVHATGTINTVCYGVRCVSPSPLSVSSRALLSPLHAAIPPSRSLFPVPPPYPSPGRAQHPPQAASPRCRLLHAHARAPYRIEHDQGEFRRAGEGIAVSLASETASSQSPPTPPPVRLPRRRSAGVEAAAAGAAVAMDGGGVGWKRRRRRAGGVGGRRRRPAVLSRLMLGEGR